MSPLTALFVQIFQDRSHTCHGELFSDVIKTASQSTQVSQSYNQETLLKAKFPFWKCTLDRSVVAWENSQRFARSPLEPSQNDVWVTSSEIPYWWCVTIQILVVSLISWKKIPTDQKHLQDLGSACHQYGISALVTQALFCKGSGGDLAKHRLFS